MNRFILDIRVAGITRRIAALIWAVSMSVAAPAVAQQQQPRIEDFRLDLSDAEVKDANVQNIGSLSMQAYLWGLPAFLHFRQTTEIKQGRLYAAPDEEPFGG